MSEPEPRKPSRTAQASPDQLGMGRTPGQRNAELVAGIRAELDRSPLAYALAKQSGRLAARILLSFGGQRGREAMSVVLAQTLSVLHLAEQKLLPDDKTVVNLAPGFGPHAFRLASSHPTVNVIEIDLPDVVAEKQRRLSQARHLPIPRNMRWIGADLGVVPLVDVLDGQKVDMVIAPGLLSYFLVDEVKRITRGIRGALRSGGVFIGDIAWGVELNNPVYQQGLNWFGRQSASLICIPNSEDEAKALLEGYEDVQIHILSELLRQMGKPMKIRDVSVLLSGVNP